MYLLGRKEGRRVQSDVVPLFGHIVADPPRLASSAPHSQLRVDAVDGAGFIRSVSA